MWLNIQAQVGHIPHTMHISNHVTVKVTKSVFFFFTIKWCSLNIFSGNFLIQPFSSIHPGCMFSRSQSCVWLFATLWSLAYTVACQAPRSMEFSQQEYWSELPFPPPNDLPNPGIKPVYSTLACGFSTTEPYGKPSSWEVWTKRILALTQLWEEIH